MTHIIVIYTPNEKRREPFTGEKNPTAKTLKTEEINKAKVEYYTTKKY